MLLTVSAGSRCGAFPLAPERVADVLRIEGSSLSTLVAVPLSEVLVFSCDTHACRVVPHQVDERDAAGRWILTHGQDVGTVNDESPGVVDHSDVLLIAARDVGQWVPPAMAPPGVITALQVRDPFFGGDAWLYIARGPIPPNTAVAVSVHYDPLHDLLVGPRVALRFEGGVPGHLSVDGGPNLLDRLKVRAQAAFLLGWFGLSRSEADLQTDLSGWHGGPIRVIRAQRQRVRLGWGIRSPTFTSYTYFYVTDFAELPVSLRLNFPPTYFFGDIRIQVLLDFRDLRGWELLVPGAAPISIGEGMDDTKHALSEKGREWFALKGPDVTLVQYLGLSSSLDSVRRRLIYREARVVTFPPESEPGELPGVGYELDRWDSVAAGFHALQATSYVLPAGLDVHRFMLAQAYPLQVSVIDPPGR